MKKMLSFWNEGISLLTSVFLLIIFSYCHAMTTMLSCFLLQTHKCWHTAGTYLKEAPCVSSWGKISINDLFFVLCHQSSISIGSCLNPYIAGKNIWEGKGERFTLVHGFRGFSPWPVVTITVDHGDEGHHGNKSTIWSRITQLRATREQREREHAGVHVPPSLMYLFFIWVLSLWRGTTRSGRAFPLS